MTVKSEDNNLKREQYGGPESSTHSSRWLLKDKTTKNSKYWKRCCQVDQTEILEYELK